jgi:hypothetical protein
MDANTFELNGENIRVIYSSQGNAGAPVLSYQDLAEPANNKTFQKADIRIVSADIGQFVTVTLVKGVDQGTKMFTLLVPLVTVVQAKTPVQIRTKAIFTTFPKVVGSNLPGPNQTYQTESLHGSAQFVFVQTAAQAGT